MKRFPALLFCLVAACRLGGSVPSDTDFAIRFSASVDTSQLEMRAYVSVAASDIQTVIFEVDPAGATTIPVPSGKGRQFHLIVFAYDTSGNMMRYFTDDPADPIVADLMGIPVDLTIQAVEAAASELGGIVGTVTANAILPRSDVTISLVDRLTGYPYPDAFTGVSGTAGDYSLLLLPLHREMVVSAVDATVSAQPSTDVLVSLNTAISLDANALLTGAETVDLSLDYGPVASLVVQADPMELLPDSVSSSSLTAMVMNDFGEPVPGHTLSAEITFTTGATQASDVGTVDLDPPAGFGSPISDATGVVTGLYTVGDTPGTAEITISDEDSSPAVTGSVVIEVLAGGLLSGTLSVAGSSVVLGDTITVDFDVINSGDDAVTDIVPPPVLTVFKTGSADVAFVSASITSPFDLNAGEQKLIQYDYQVTSPSGTITFEVGADGTDALTGLTVSTGVITMAAVTVAGTGTGPAMIDVQVKPGLGEITVILENGPNAFDSPTTAMTIEITNSGEAPILNPTVSLMTMFSSSGVDPAGELTPKELNFDQPTDPIDSGEIQSINRQLAVNPTADGVARFEFSVSGIDGFDGSTVVASGTVQTGRFKMLRDSDGDGLSDGFEAHLPDDPLLPVSCNYSFYQRLNPFAIDTDGDSFSDRDELQSNSNPCDDQSTPTLAVPDTDGDGLTDTDETTVYGTAPDRRDTDVDGLTDGLEVNLLLSDPLAPDSDGDGLPDGVATDFGFCPLRTPQCGGTPFPGFADTDLDGLPDDMELAISQIFYGQPGELLPDEADTDGDNMSDLFELAVGQDPRSNSQAPPMGYDSNDLDRDGIVDSAETGTRVFLGVANTGTDPARTDSDMDHLPDGIELYSLTTNPVRDDSDEGGLEDGLELILGKDPRDRVNDYDGDRDGDGLSDWIEEKATDTDPFNPNTDQDDMDDYRELAIGRDPHWAFDATTTFPPVAADTDQDGLIDTDESLAGSSLTDIDTDDDGIPDGIEVHGLGTDPTTAHSDVGGLSDFWEWAFGGNNNSTAGYGASAIDPLDDVRIDVDRDGVPDLLELRLGLRLGSAFSDTDFFPDGTELKLGAKAFDSNDTPTSFPFPDDDQDGLDNATEVSLGTDPTFSDSDVDGLLDGMEVNTFNGATFPAVDPTLWSTDAAPESDLSELSFGRSPTYPLDDFDFTTCTDSDGDGWCLQNGDCNDSDPLVNPFRLEDCGASGIDHDCDFNAPSVDPDCAATSFCGDGTCALDESHDRCPADCSCGNGSCDLGETVFSCSADCS